MRRLLEETSKIPIWPNAPRLKSVLDPGEKSVYQAQVTRPFGSWLWVTLLASLPLTLPHAYTANCIVPQVPPRACVCQDPA